MSKYKYKTTGNIGLFDEEAISEKLSSLGNPLEKLNGVKNPGFGYSDDRKDPYIYIYLKPGQNHLLLNYISKGASVLALAQASASGHGSFLKGIRREITFLAEENKQYQVEFNPKISEFIISAY